MSNAPSLEMQMKKSALSWAITGLMLALGLILSIAYLVPLQEVRSEIKNFAQGAMSSHRSDLLLGDVRSTELQLRRELRIGAGEELLFLDAKKQRWVADTAPLSLIACNAGDGVCVDRIGNRAVLYEPLYFDEAKTSLWGYLYIEKKPQTNWSMVFWLSLSVAIAMGVQAVGTYEMIARSMKNISGVLTQWSSRLSATPKSLALHTSVPYAEISMLEVALGNLRSEISSLEAMAREDGALSTLRAVGHDILNPVARMKRIMGGIKKPEHDDSSPLDREIYLALLGNIRRLSNYGEQLKHLHKIRTENDVSELAPINVSNEIENLALEMRHDPDVIDKKIQILVTSEGEYRSKIPVAAFGRMTENILANSVHASRPNGRIEISLGLCENKICLKIKDYGCGISQAALGRIFDVDFTQKMGRGTGLGLSVVKQICEQYGAQIRVESTLDVGTTTTIEFRMAEVVHEQATLIG